MRPRQLRESESFDENALNVFRVHVSGGKDDLPQVVYIGMPLRMIKIVRKRNVNSVYMTAYGVDANGNQFIGQKVLMSALNAAVGRPIRLAEVLDVKPVDVPISKDLETLEFSDVSDVYKPDYDKNFDDRDFRSLVYERISSYRRRKT